MNDNTPDPKQPKSTAAQPSDSREEHLKAALRANLMRRKAQVRGRAAQDGQEDE